MFSGGDRTFFKVLFISIMQNGCKVVLEVMPVLLQLKWLTVCVNSSSDVGRQMTSVMHNRSEFLTAKPSFFFSSNSWDLSFKACFIAVSFL